ncbi:hypothetical protein AAJ76_2250001096 [Vairimorpha ceranae]|uniref:Uncharacterized protein n=1 Tax=Vairimorpha ceranae TaxID=40302 RepID=A0A0F9Z7A8_9MICR|nr:hypothetical protein AAJ76_2250001096 [Vairimorpha ceranae]KKO73804.1 hypothetical protein AAJ76_2250001096 [Vairimorpha ceranae]
MQSYKKYIPFLHKFITFIYFTNRKNMIDLQSFLKIEMKYIFIFFLSDKC